MKLAMATLAVSSLIYAASMFSRSSPEFATPPWAAPVATTSRVVERPAQSLFTMDLSGDRFGNDAIDMEGFLQVANDAASHRESRRVSEDEFIRMSKEPGTIILDARSRDRFDILHVKGAINLPFADISIASLAETIPDKNTRILIYCNNNFRNNERAFASKISFASLNLSTYATLYGHGYRNVYELGPRSDVNLTTLPLVSSPATRTTYADAATMIQFRLVDG